MNIHFAITHSEAGGLVEIWNDIADALSRRGHRTARFALYPKTDNAPSPQGWRHLVGNRSRSLLTAFAVLWALIRYLRQERPDVVVTAMPAANVLLPLAVRVAGVRSKVIISHHSPVETYHGLLDRLDSLTGQLGCVRAVVSVSRTVHKSLAAKPGSYRSKRVVITNALPDAVEKLVDQLRGDRMPTQPPRRLIALGRLSYQKNYPLLIAAMAQVPQATLEIVGAGEDEGALRALAQDSGVADRISFLGYMPRAVALARASQADIFVQVSHYEGHSLALIEAARLGLPLIVSDVPVQVEGITARDGTRCGQVVPIDNPQSLAASMIALLEKPEHYALWAQRSRMLGLEASNEAMVDCYEALFGVEDKNGEAELGCPGDGRPVLAAGTARTEMNR